MSNSIVDQLNQSELIDILVNNTPVAYIILDKEYRIHFLNDYFIKMRGFDKEKVMGELCYNLSNGGKRCAICAVANAIKSGEKCMVTRKDTLPDGRVRFIDDYAIPLFSKQKEQEYILEIMVDRSAEMQQRERREESFQEILRTFSSLLDAKDPYTAQHSMSVRKLSERLARFMGLTPTEIFEIDVAATLHDIGKVKIPLSIINKNGKLTNEEYEIIKDHPVQSFNIIKGLLGFGKVKEYVHQHHERYDGRGYPNGLKGENIALGARIIAVADTYDAMTSTRAYRNALSHDIAIEEIYKNASTQFDPDIVHALMLLEPRENEWEGTLNPATPKRTIERTIAANHTYNPKTSTKGISDIMTESELVAEIFKNTPAAYVVLDDNKTILFTSDTFLELMGLQGIDISGMHCYDVSHKGTACHHCAVDRAMHSRKVEYERVEKDTPLGKKWIDTYAVPFDSTGNDQQYIIEILLDRTEEVVLNQEREDNFHYLIHTLSNLLDQNMSELQSAEIDALTQRMETLFS